MRHWHYQLMRHKLARPNDVDGEYYYAIHGLYEMYDGPAWTDEPIQVAGESVEEVKEKLTRMLADVEKHGVKDYD